MSSPVEQYVPDEFQDELDLPTPGQVDGIALGRAQMDLKQAQRRASERGARVKYLQGRAKKAKGEKAKKRARATLEKARDAYASAQKKQASAQNAVYKTGGQFDKLLKGENRDAYLALQALFGEFGLGSLAPKIFDYVKQGYGADTIGLLLQDTKEYKERFAANEARKKKGLPVLAPADYLAAESAYRQVLGAAGLPKGFYDNPADFQRWISDDVAPAEIQSRVDLAVAATSQSNPQYRAALYQMYGISERDLTAYFLDGKKAEPLLKKQAAAGAIGAAALRRGFAANTLDLEGYATMGVTADQAEEAYSRIADGFETMLGIAGRFGSQWTQQLAEQEYFTPGSAGSVGAENAAEKGKRLRSQERALFSGGRGSSAAGLSGGYRQT